MVRSRFQSVAGSLFEMAPEVSSFMGLGPPGRYEMSLVGFTVGIDHRDLDTIHKSDSVDPHLAIVEAVIGSLDRRSVEDSRRILKGNSVPTNVGEILVGIPSELHASFYIMESRFEALGGGASPAFAHRPPGPFRDLHR